MCRHDPIRHQHRHNHSSCHHHQRHQHHYRRPWPHPHRLIIYNSCHHHHVTAAIMTVIVIPRGGVWMPECTEPARGGDHTTRMLQTTRRRPKAATVLCTGTSQPANPPKGNARFQHAGRGSAAAPASRACRAKNQKLRPTTISQQQVAGNRNCKQNTSVPSRQPDNRMRRSISKPRQRATLTTNGTTFCRP